MPHATPQGFHAAAEVFLDGSGHLLGSTSKVQTAVRAVIGASIAAVSAAILSSFNPIKMVDQLVGAFCFR